MKKFIILVFISIGFHACNYLDIVPDNVATLENAFTMRNTAERYLFTCYSYLPQNGNLTADPGFLGGGELWPLYQVTVSGAGFARGEQGVVSPLLNYWDGLRDGKALYRGIRDCNIFLENIYDVPDMEEEEKDRWAAEAKFLKAYYHFFLLRMYGPIPIIRENLPIDAGMEDVRVSRESAETGFDYVVQLIDEAIPNLPLVILDEGSELGRITLPIATSVKALVLVTAASPLFNGNTDYPYFTDQTGLPLFNPEYSEEKWRRAVEAAGTAINICHEAGLSLYRFQPQQGSSVHTSDTTLIQMSIRNSVTEKWNSEIIWANSNYYPNQPGLTPRTWDPARSITALQGRYGPTIDLALLYYTANGVPLEEDRDWDYSNRFNLRAAQVEDRYNIKQGYTTVGFHFDRENRFYASIGFDGGIWYGQGKFNDNDTWVIEGKAGQAASRQIETHYSPTGYWAKKLIHYQNVVGTSSYSVINYPWPNMRLADLYLLYAEALNEYSGPGADTYEFINKVRDRAGLPTVEDSWTHHSKNPTKYQTKEGLREIIRQERQIELSLEGKRYWDLLRWKTAHTELSKPITGWDLPQSEAELYYRETVVFQRSFNIRDYFQPVREYDIVRNRNLLQSPGW